MRFWVVGLCSLLWCEGGSAQTKKPDLGLLQMQCDEAGMALQCAQAGVLLEQKKQIKQAAIYYKKACFAQIKPQGTSCYLLALLLSDPKEAWSLYQRACSLKEPDGCTSAGEYANKSSDPTLRQKAAALYQQGCQLGDGRGCHRMARLLFAQKREEPAIPLLKRACTLKYAPGCGYLGWHYETKSKDAVRAEKLFRIGCALRGGSIECARLGLLLMRKGQPREALRFLRRSCRQGFRQGCLRARQLGKSIEPSPRP